MVARRVRLFLAQCVMVISALAVLGWYVDSASAQTAPGGTSTTTTTQANHGASANQNQAWPWLAFAAIAAGVIGTGLVLLFVTSDSERGQRTLREALELGHPTQVTLIGSLDGGGVAALAADGFAQIDGPKLVEVGSEATYSAKVNGQSGGVTWRVDPSEMADVAPGAQVSIKIRPKKAGQFKVYAKSGAGDSDAFPVVAVPSSIPTAWSVPFFGQGWGSIIIAISLATVVAALGFVRVLGGEAIATFFGALAGYVFHRTASEAAANKGKQAAGDANGHDGAPPTPG